MSDKRWCVVVEYCTEAGLCDVDWDIEELEEIHDLVERGPHWDTIKRIVITRNNLQEALTIEAAEKL